MIKIEHNIDAWAKEIKLLSDKELNAAFKKSMKRALKRGRNTSRQELRKKIRGPKGKTWTKYFNEKTKMSKVSADFYGFSGYLEYSSHQHGLAAYTTQGRLERHRTKMNQRGFKKGKKGAPAIRFDLIPGKKTILKRTFSGRRGGSGPLQVWRRPLAGTKLERPLGHSLAQQMRSTRNKVVMIKTKRDMEQIYFSTFSGDVKGRIARIRNRMKSRSV